MKKIVDTGLDTCGTTNEMCNVESVSLGVKKEYACQRKHPLKQNENFVENLKNFS